MKTWLFAAALCLNLGLGAWAQQGFANDPATKEDVEAYMAAIHSRELTKQSLQAMSKPMHQFIEDTFEKDRDRLPPDFEEQMTRFMDDYLNNMPIDQMQQAAIPIYQKHFTKGDLAALVAFYSSPTGEKLLREMPAIMSESMTVELPYMREQIEKLRERMQDQVAEMLKKAPKSSSPKAGTLVN